MRGSNPRTRFVRCSGRNPRFLIPVALIIWLYPVPKGSYSGHIRLLHSAELFFSGVLTRRGCPMLIPLRHENMEGRRWPVVTFALIGLNVLVFLGTPWKIEAQEPERQQVRAHLVVLAATNPELKMPPDAEKFVEEVKSKA